MKNERSRDLQVNRIDNQKSDVARHVSELPASGREGSFVCVGELPVGGYRGDGLYIRLFGEWRLIGVIEND